MTSDSKEGLVIVGCGGHGRSVADVALTCGFKELLFLDANAKEDERILGFPVVAEIEELQSGWNCIPASGEGETRSEQLAMAGDRGWPVVSVVSPNATIGAMASMGRGCFVGYHAHVGPNTVIGDGCIINTGAVIEHDCSVGDFSHISINAALAGEVSIGRGCFVGAGATIIDAVALCDHVLVGAGGVVVEPIIKAGRYVGVPARAIQ